MNKLCKEYQVKYKSRQYYDKNVINDISSGVKLHKEIDSPMSSAASCINVLGNIKKDKVGLCKFLNYFKLNVEKILDFPTGVNVGREIYDDKGPVVFEWIGPKSSPIKEIGGSRGQRKTSIDALVLAIIDNKITQVFIEWKFTEKYPGEKEYNICKFAGKKGNERLCRYSAVLADLRNRDDFPFNMMENGGLGLYDFSYEPYYQLMRITLLAKMTTPLCNDASIKIEGYKVLHLTHSCNSDLNVLRTDHLKYSPGLQKYAGKDLHETWKNHILSKKESANFCHGYWDKALATVCDLDLKKYLMERYG